MPKKQNRKASRSQWERESGKESFWRKQIAAWKASGQTVRSFAKANGFSQQLFYSWRREISIRDRELSVAATAGAARDSSGIANSHVTDARGRVVPLRFRDTPKDAIKTGPFVPVTVVPDVADTSKPKGAASHQLAMLGLPFAFASHFAPEELHRALRVYRKTFRPSATLKKPYVMIGVPVVTAETNDRALFLATTPLLRILKRVRNESMELQPPIEPQEMEKLWTYHERLAVYERFGIAAVGSVQTVRDKLASLLESTEADELMIVSDL